MRKVTPRLFAAVVSDRPAITYGLQTEDLSAADHRYLLKRGRYRVNCFSRAELHFCSED